MTAGRAVTSLLVLAMLAAACAETSGTPASSTTTPPSTAAPTTSSPPGSDAPVTFAPDAVEASSGLERETAPDATFDDLADRVFADTALAIDLFTAVAGRDNLIMSPYSVATALTMTYAGAVGQTRDEMGRVLGIQGDRPVHAARNLLDIALARSAAAPHEEGEPPPLQLATANSLWGQRDYPFHAAFLDTIARNYGSGVRLVDYVSDPDGARQAINAWVEDQTNDRIVDLIAPGVVTPDTRLTLVNAIWFKANWLYEFSEDATTPEPFTRFDATTVDAPTMHGTLTTTYAAGPGYQAVRLPYVGDAAMLVIVPDEGEYDAFVGSLTPNSLHDIRRALSVHQVQLALPKFAFRTQLGLDAVLKALGMPTAFVPPPGPDSADFTGITPARELFISAVLHQAFIDLDEHGTEAAAATAVVVGATSLPPQAELRVDRPFLFLITHLKTNEILFMGQVADPTA